MGGVALGAIVSRKGVAPSQFPQHVVHLIGVDGGVIPTHAVASLPKVGTDLSVRHAPHELVPRRLQSFPKRDARLSGVVEEFVVSDPQGGVPGFVVCPTVHAVAPFVCCVYPSRCPGRSAPRVVTVWRLD